MKKLTFLLILSGLCLSFQGKAQTTADTTGIKETVLNYIEGFYTADAARMEKALHYDLAKRYVTPERNGRNYVQNMTAMMLYQVTKMQKDQRPEHGELQCEIIINEIYGKVAIVRAETTFFNFVDFIQLGKINGEWKIVNVIWERKPVKEDS